MQRVNRFGGGLTSPREKRSVPAVSGSVGPTTATSVRDAKLDFIEKYAASSPRLDVKDYFLPEDLVGSF